MQVQGEGTDYIESAVVLIKSFRGASNRLFGSDEQCPFALPFGRDEELFGQGTNQSADAGAQYQRPYCRATEGGVGHADEGRHADPHKYSDRGFDPCYPQRMNRSAKLFTVKAERIRRDPPECPVQHSEYQC